MRAAEIRAYGEPPVLGERPRPEASVPVRAAGLNPIDIRLASGTLPGRARDLPYVPGSEAIVERDGRRFYADASGAFAEYCTTSTETEVPAGVEDGLALACGIAGLAAWLALQRRAEVKPGDRVLILGATGVVGLIGVQAAKLMGASVVVASGRDPDGLARAREHGADAVVRLGEDITPDAFTEAAGGELDVVLDPLWGKPAQVALEAMASRGRFVNLGQSAGATAELPSATIRFRELSILGHTNFAAPPEVRGPALERMFMHAAAGELWAPYEAIALDDVAEAWRRQADSPNTKLVLVP
jgi:NADPH:quinone reductase-like Zn-dependent oxidoreductase